MTYRFRTRVQRERARFVMAYCAMFVLFGFFVSFFAALMAAGGHK